MDSKKLSKLEREEAELRRLKARMDRINSSRKERERKQDTRGKILLGVLMQTQIADRSISYDEFSSLVDRVITSEKDREICREIFSRFSGANLEERSIDSEEIKQLDPVENPKPIFTPKTNTGIKPDRSEL